VQCRCSQCRSSNGLLEVEDVVEQKQSRCALPKNLIAGYPEQDLVDDDGFGGMLNLDPVRAGARAGAQLERQQQQRNLEEEMSVSGTS